MELECSRVLASIFYYKRAGTRADIVCVTHTAHEAKSTVHINLKVGSTAFKQSPWSDMARLHIIISRGCVLELVGAIGGSAAGLASRMAHRLTHPRDATTLLRLLLLLRGCFF